MAEKMSLQQVRDWAAKTPANNGWKAKERDEAVAAIDAHLAQPSQAVDCPACEGRPASGNSPCHVCGKSAQAEGWDINKRGDVWDVTYTPPTQDTPNAHE